MASGAVRRSGAYQKTVKKVVGGRGRQPLSPPNATYLRVATRNDALHLIAAEYEKIGNCTLSPVARAATGDNRLVPPILQPAVAALAKVGVRPRDYTIGSFRFVGKLSGKDVRHICVHAGAHVDPAGQHIAAICRGRIHRA